MDREPTHTGRRVLRVLLASGFLALGWVAIDTITHATPAAAAETIDLVPLIDDTLDGVVTTVETVAAPVVTTVTEPVTPIVSAVVAEAVAPVVTEVVTPVVVPILEAAEPIVAPIVAPIVDVVDNATPFVTELSFVTGNEELVAGGALIVGSLLAASLAPLLPVLPTGTPRNVPLAPTEPTGAGSSTLLAIYGELNSGIQAAWSALRAGPLHGDVLPSSPTFAFDTTPD